MGFAKHHHIIFDWGSICDFLSCSAVIGQWVLVPKSPDSSSCPRGSSGHALKAGTVVLLRWDPSVELHLVLLQAFSVDLSTKTQFLGGTKEKFRDKKSLQAQSQGARFLNVAT